METVGSIISYGWQVYTLLDNSQHNKKVFRQLRDFLVVCVEIIETASEHNLISNDAAIIKLFKERVEDAENFAREYQDMGGVMRFFKSTKMKNEANELCNALSGLNGLLNTKLNLLGKVNKPKVVDRKQIDEACDEDLEEEKKEIQKNITIKTNDTLEIQDLKKKQAEMLTQYEQCLTKNNQFKFSYNVKVPEGVKEIYSPDLSYESKIGDGSFGFIYKGKYLDKDVAIKVVKNVSTDTIEKLFREAHNLNRSKGPNVMEIYGVCIEPGFECIVMELLPNGSLEDYIQQSNEIISGSRKLDIASGIIQGIETIHLSGRTHRGISPSKILFTSDFVPKISNFDEVNSITGTIAPAALNSPKTQYCHPDAIFNPYFSHQSIDIYSYGCILLFIFSKSPPTRNISYIIENYAHKNQKGLSAEEIAERSQRIFSYLRSNKVTTTIQEVERTISILDSIHEDVCRIIKLCLSTSNDNMLSSTIRKQIISLKNGYAIHYQMGCDHEGSKDYNSALECYKYACERGYGRGFFRYGYLHMKRELTFYDPQIAREYFIKATENRSSETPRAFYNLGVIYESGIGVPVDIRKALAYYRQAANLGFSDAETRVKSIESKIPG